MGNRPRLLDLFCCQGGAAMGYHRAGFEVVGVDIAPQPRFPFSFVRADALEYLRQHGHEYDLIHASPPCQAYSEATPLRHRERLPRLIAPVRDLLLALGQPYIIENVAGARAELRDPLMLCGTMFGLPVWRHRYFELGNGVDVAQLPPACRHNGPPVTLHSGSNTRKVRGNTTTKQAAEAMGIDWMTLGGLQESIPPAYTKWLGGQVLLDWNAP